MRERFEGTEGERRLRDELLRQKIVLGDMTIAEQLAVTPDIVELSKDELLIEQNAEDNDVYLILSGSCRVVVNGKTIAIRHAGNHVGEMAAIEPGQKRAASVVAVSDSTVLLRLTEARLAQLAEKHPKIWLQFAKELSRRLEERNRFISQPHEKIRLFVISSKEAMHVAQAIQDAFQHDDFETQLWTNDVFKVANYTIEDLEGEIESSDFAVAIAFGDDIVESRDRVWPAPRDNVIFELGLFMGRLGKKRAVLMEPRGDGVKLPSDLAGITTIPYKSGELRDITRLMGPACSALRKHILQLGRRE